MKRSLNNRFKGKRLVEGDENEITAHELLLKEEDDKIVVKGRDSNGNVEVLSGGNSDSDGAPNVWYYTVGSYSGVSNNSNVLTKTESGVSLVDFFTTGVNEVIPEGMTDIARYIKKMFLGCSSTVNAKNSIKELSVQGGKELVITVNDKNEGICSTNSIASSGVFLIRDSIDYYKEEEGNSSYIDGSRFDLYDSTTNTLLYYASGSNYDKVTITPKELADSINLIIGDSDIDRKLHWNFILNGEELFEDDPRIKVVLRYIE